VSLNEDQQIREACSLAVVQCMPVLFLGNVKATSNLKHRFDDRDRIDIGTCRYVSAPAPGNWNTIITLPSQHLEVQAKSGSRQ
jgi:hypothetical protein